MAQGVLSGIALGAVFSIGAAGAISVLVPVQPSPAPQVGTAETVAPPQAPAPQVPAVVTSDNEAAVLNQPNATLSTPEDPTLPVEPAAAAQAPEVTTTLEQAKQTALLQDLPAETPAVQATPLAPRPVPSLVHENSPSDAAPQLPDPLPAQPSTGAVETLPEPDALPEAQTAQISEIEPVLPNPQALAPMIPDDSVDVQVADQSSAPAQPAEQSGVSVAVVPEAEEPEIVVPEAPVLQPEPETQVAEAPQEAVQEPETAPDEQEAVNPAPLPGIVDAPGVRVSEVPGARVAALGSDARPRVGTPATTLIRPRSDGAAVPIETVTQAAPTDPSQQRPIQRYARAFQNPEDKPLMSIVLIDSGVDLDAAEIGVPALSSFPYPISFAVNASLPDAFERMERYRAEGFEVLAMLDLPTAAQPTDAEVSLAVTLNGLPEVIGVIEGTGEGLQSSREVADQVTGILRASGHGLVTQSKGLNSMPKLAVKEGVPAAPVFRDFDSQGQQPRVIRRFLDQAAFKAGQEGGVIMLGRLRPETIEALLVWALADRAGTVALSPVSAVLLAQR